MTRPKINLVLKIKSMIETDKPKKMQPKVLEPNQARMVYECLINRNNSNWSEIDNLCFLSKNLYNHINYILISKNNENIVEYNNWVKNGKVGDKPKLYLPSYFELDPLLRNNQEYPDYTKLPAVPAQKIVRTLSVIWSSYKKSLFDYYKNPTKYKSIPRPPGFKHKTDGRFLVPYTISGVQNSFLEKGIIKLAKSNIEIPFNIKNVQITEVRLVPMANKLYKVEVVYIKKIVKQDLNENNHLYVDLGIDNLTTCLDNIANKPFIVSGKLIKSVNRKYNDDIARLTSILQLREPNRKTTTQIERVRVDRNNKIKTLFHKISKQIVDYCSEHKIKTIIIGKNDNWKQNLTEKLPKEFNQRFTQIPYQMLINQLTYKMENIGGEVIQVEESYTSKCDHLALEPMVHQEKYLGKRDNKKALFKSSTGVELHDDVNGCIGIARKHLKTKTLEKVLIDTIIGNNNQFFPRKFLVKL